MSGAIVKVVVPPIEPRLGRFSVEYTQTDAERLGTFAVVRGEWQYLTDHGGSVPVGSLASRSPNWPTETVAAIASPDGRVAVWYGQYRAAKMDNYFAALASFVRSTDKDQAEPSSCTCLSCGAEHTAILVQAALDIHVPNSNRELMLARFAAMQWNHRYGHGGRRDVKPLSRAACRVLHAQAFGEKPNPRDYYLAEMLALGTKRPNTRTIVNASDKVLAAASALIMIDKPYIHDYIRELLINASKREVA